MIPSKIQCLFCGLLATAVCGGLPGQVTWIVPGPQGPTIQAAIDAAGPGDVVLVSAGTWYEAIDFHGKTITVRGIGGAQATIIDGQHQEIALVSFVAGEPPQSILEGFTIRRGGHGIVIRNGAAPTIRQCIIAQNRWSEGGPAEGAGVMCAGGSATLVSCQISENSLYSAAYATRGAGIFCTGGALQLINCLVARNAAYGDGGGGGGIWADGPLQIVACTIANNVALDGFANLEHGPGPNAVTSSIVWTDGWPYFGSGICNSCGPISITWSLVRGGWPGFGNLDADPRFVDSPAGDFHLRGRSPCIDAGNPAVAGWIDSDLDGEPRSSYMAIDMGADEWLPARVASLSLTQPAGPGSLLITVAAPIPSAPFLELISFDPSNGGPGAGSGPWAGLFLPESELLAQAAYGAPPFVGMLDQAGASTFVLPAGSLVALAGLGAYSIVHVADPSSGTVLAVSNVAALLIQ